MRIHRLATIAALVIVAPLLLFGCDGSFLNADRYPMNQPVCPMGQVYACNLAADLTPHPAGWLGSPDPTPGRQILYGCGQPICATDSVAATAACAAPAGLPVDAPQLFVVPLGNTPSEIQAAEPGAVVAWAAAGSPCIRQKAGDCNPCDDGQGGMLQNVGEHCGDPAPGVPQCCAGLTCVGATADFMGVCQGTPQCPQAQPNWQPLTTTMLRQIAIQNKADGCDTQSGITQSRTIGLLFERWVLTALGVIPKPPGPDRNKMSFMSMVRKNKTGGLPASVIPEFVGDQTYTVAGMSATFTNGVFYEVKAVTGALTPGTSNWQVLGLLDAVNTQITKPAGPHPAPAVFFITTGNTTVSSGVLTQATMPTWSVAVWQQQVLYDANGGSNPNLTLGPPVCLTPNLCTSSAPVAVPTNPGPPVSPLTSPTTPPSTLLVPGDPDPPEVD